MKPVGNGRRREAFGINPVEERRPPNGEHDVVELNRATCVLR
jgi:hypothetical protein